LFLIATLGSLSCLLALILTPLVRDWIGPYGFLDRPDGGRKKHSAPVPRVGGIAIALAYCLTFAIALILPFSYTQLLHSSFSSIWKIAIPASVVFLTGLLDDLLALSPTKKLFGILVACVLALWAGIRVDIHLLTTSAHPVLSAVITVVWLVGCTNAFNLIDGMDGLAAGVGFLATVAMMLAGLTQGNLTLVLATLPLAGCLLGFLFFNFNPASVFLGDGGSLLVGFLLGSYGAVWSEKSVTVVALIAPALALSVPMLDVGLSIVRRFLRNRPIFEADRGHIHHKLLDRGLSPRGVVLSIYGFCGVAATLSLLAGALHNQFSGLIVICFCGFAWFGIKHLNYSEFKTASQMFLKGGFRRIIDAETRLMELEQALLNARDLNECWGMVLAGSREFGFEGVRLSAHGGLYEAPPRSGVKRSWQLRIPLAHSHYINFTRDFESNLDPVILSAFVDCMERGLKRKADAPRPEVIEMPVNRPTFEHLPSPVNVVTSPVSFRRDQVAQNS
jgi:UDP-GlcNAc:undecaprenyl-phosphate/decaprenyl-phosphate GlcNAc-1-phosphate transferase